MEREWSALLERYGQRVVLHQGEQETAGRAFLQPIREQLHDPETLQEDFEAEEQRLRKERREALQDWVGTNGVEACREEVEKIWNGA